MNHSTAIFVDRIVLKPIMFSSMLIILYGIFSSNGTWMLALLGFIGVAASSMIGQSLYPKATTSDLASGRAWNKEGSDSEIK